MWRVEITRDGGVSGGEWSADRLGQACAQDAPQSRDLYNYPLNYAAMSLKTINPCFVSKKVHMVWSLLDGWITVKHNVDKRKIIYSALAGNASGQ